MFALNSIETPLQMIGIAIGLLALARGVYELYQKNLIARVDQYMHMREIYARDKDIKKVCAALGERGDGSIEDLDYQEKRQFLGTIETVALMTRSGIMNEYISAYMFGHYAIVAWESDEFWGHGNLDRNDPLWALFAEFVAQTKVRLKRMEDEPKKYLPNLSFHSRLGTEIRKMDPPS